MGDLDAYADALVLRCPVRHLGELGGIVGVENTLLRRVEANERGVRGRVCSGGLRCGAGSADGDQVRLVRAVDRVHRVVDGGVQDREVPRRLDGRRLRTRGVDDREEGLVPIEYRLPRPPGLPACAFFPLRRWPSERGCRRESEHENRCCDCESLHLCELLRIDYYGYVGVT